MRLVLITYFSSKCLQYMIVYLVVETSLTHFLCCKQESQNKRKGTFSSILLRSSRHIERGCKRICSEKDIQPISYVLRETG